MGCSASAPTDIPCANGTLRVGARVQTMWDEGVGHDRLWYVGTVNRISSRSTASILYDDGDRWTGGTKWMYLLPPGHPGLTQRLLAGSATQNGPPAHILPPVVVAGVPVPVAVPQCLGTHTGPVPVAAGGNPPIVSPVAIAVAIP